MNKLEEGYIIPIADLWKILHKMSFYKRTEGYVAYIGEGEITFFDSKPSIDSVYITKDQIKKALIS